MKRSSKGNSREEGKKGRNRGGAPRTGAAPLPLDPEERNPEANEADWRPAALLTQPFAVIGRAAIGWTNNLGAAAVFLLLALLKIPRPKQFAKVVQQIYYIGARSTLIIHAYRPLHRDGPGSPIVPCPG